MSNPGPTAAVKKQPTVYVVDDDPAIREATDSLVRSAGLSVETFASAQDFLHCNPGDASGCVVLDVGLPGLSGLDLQRELIQANIHIPVIFVTGNGDIPTSVRAMKAGAVEFLTKPFRDDDLLGAIQQAIERDQAAQLKISERERELRAAANIQQGLMALTIPQLPFVALTGKNLSCTEIGGDFFMAVAVEETLVAVIADVSGKGISAAVMASLLQGMIHEDLLARVSLPGIARNVNEFFCQRDLGSKYATFVIVCVPPNGEMEYLNCAHVPPLVVSAQNGVRRLRESNVPVGLLPNVSYQSAKFHLSTGDRIILVTDGVTEAEGPAGDFYGDERLEESAARGMTAGQIFTSVRQFCADHPMSDDCTVLGLDYLGNSDMSF
jgi:FixJ family two-component response regulator